MAMPTQGRRDSYRDLENPPVEAPPASLVYAAASTKLAGPTKDCAICLDEFEDGDAICIMPACRHGFHESCIKRWFARGRRSSCPTCRAPAAVATAAATAVQPDEAANQREAYTDHGDNAGILVLFAVMALQIIVSMLVAVLPN